jgi:hypothetical protein
MRERKDFQQAIDRPPVQTINLGNVSDFEQRSSVSCGAGGFACRIVPRLGAKTDAAPETPRQRGCVADQAELI